MESAGLGASFRFESYLRSQFLYLILNSFAADSIGGVECYPDRTENPRVTNPYVPDDNVQDARSVWPNYGPDFFHRIEPFELW